MLDTINRLGLSLKPPTTVLGRIKDSVPGELALQIQHWIRTTPEGRQWAFEQREAWEAVSGRADVDRVRREVDLDRFAPDREYVFGRCDEEIVMIVSDEEEGL